jgi:glycosyltransferase involved in cell wall biosynthesis
VSIVVPCRDEEAVIRRKIRNSIGLRFPDRRLSEVLIVDDGSTDSTVAIVESEIARHKAGHDLLALRLVTNPYESGKAGALRAGIEQARGEIVLVTDADVLIEREGLARESSAASRRTARAYQPIRPPRRETRARCRAAR